MSVNDTEGIKSISESPSEGLTLKVNITKRYVFSNLQVEAAKLETQRLPLSRMVQELERKFGKKFAVTSISRALNEFRGSGTANRIHTAFEELQAAHYWEMSREIQGEQGKFLEKGRQTVKQLLLEGFWPFSSRLLADAYFMDEQRKICLDHERGKVLKRAMQRIINGEHPYRVAKEEGLDSGHVYRKFRNPFYKGCVRYGREVLQGKHEALIDSETWDKLQHALDLVGPVSKFGFERSAEGTVVNGEKTDVIRQVCSLRCERKTVAQIAKKLTLTYVSVGKILNDPDYKKVVGDKLWEDAHNIKFDKADTLKQFHAKRRTQHQTKVTLYLSNHEPSLLGQISMGTELGKKAVSTTLRELKEAGDVNLETGHGHLNRWFLVNQAQMARHDEEPEKKILETLATPLTFTQVKNKTGLPHTTLARGLRRLRDQKKVEKRSEPGKRYPVYVKLSPPQKAE